MDKIEIPLEAIIVKEKLKGFRVKGMTKYFDGDEWSGKTEYLILPAGKDAPGVYKIEKMGETQREPWHMLRQYIVTGEKKVKQKAYSLAKELAEKEVKWRNEYAKQNENILSAILIDQGKKFLDYDLILI